MKIAYIAHPVSGEGPAALTELARIARQINEYEAEVVPFIPYYLDLLVLDENNPKERSRGIKNVTHTIRNTKIDELRLYGKKISAGMWAEIRLARELGIEVRAMTKETTKELIANPLVF
jgi:hypothetical protein